MPGERLGISILDLNMDGPLQNNFQADWLIRFGFNRYDSVDDDVLVLPTGWTKVRKIEQEEVVGKDSQGRLLIHDHEGTRKIINIYGHQLTRGIKVR